MPAKKNTTLLNPLQKTRLHEEIAAQLKDKIMNREILPDEKLPPERSLAESLGVNRSTVREAFNKLESMGLVEIRHGDGVYVKDYLDSGSLELVKYMLFRDGVPDAEIISNLSNLRRILVPEIVFQAATNRSDEDLRALETIALDSEDMPMPERDWRVNNILARASGNFLFTVLLNSFTGLLKDYAFLYFDDEENVKRSERFHREVFEAVCERDAAKARRIAEDVYRYAEDAMFRGINDYICKNRELIQYAIKRSIRE